MIKKICILFSVVFFALGSNLASIEAAPFGYRDLQTFDQQKRWDKTTDYNRCVEIPGWGAAQTGGNRLVDGSVEGEIPDVMKVVEDDGGNYVSLTRSATDGRRAFWKTISFDAVLYTDLITVSADIWLQNPNGVFPENQDANLPLNCPLIPATNTDYQFKTDFRLFRPDLMFLSDGFHLRLRDSREDDSKALYLTNPADIEHSGDFTYGEWHNVAYEMNFATKKSRVFVDGELVKGLTGETEFTINDEFLKYIVDNKKFYFLYLTINPLIEGTTYEVRVRNIKAVRSVPLSPTATADKAEYAPDEAITLSFNTIIDTETLNSENLYIENAYNEKEAVVLGEYDALNNSVTVTPVHPLEYDAEYMVVISEGLKSKFNTSNTTKKTTTIRTKAAPTNISQTELKLENDEVFFSGSVDNTSGAPAVISVIYCMYDDEGNVIKITHKQVEVGAGVTPVEYSYSTTGITDLHKVDVFVLNGAFNSKNVELMSVSQVIKGGSGQ